VVPLSSSSLTYPHSAAKKWLVWVVTVWVGEVSLNGRRMTKYAKTQKEARDWVNATLGKIDHGLTFDGAQLTLAQYMESWLSGKDLARRPSTVRNYRRYRDLYILPALGRLKLQSIFSMHVRQLYIRMQQDGKGARKIQLVHVTLHCAFAQAVKEGLVGYNPMDAVERPKVETKRYDILTEEQARTFRSAVKSHPLEALFFLALTTSIRKGEILGLMWTDVDWEKHTLRVERQLQPVSFKTGALVPTKTKAGRRAILIGPGTMALLKEHREKQERQRLLAGDRWQEHGMIFTTSIGTYIDQTKVSRAFKDVLKKAGLPEIRFHDLRHTSISILLENGTLVNTVQSRAGHSKASVTTDIYGRTLARSQQEAAQLIEQIIDPLPNELVSE
jgi:integrase